MKPFLALVVLLALGLYVKRQIAPSPTDLRNDRFQWAADFVRKQPAGRGTATFPKDAALATSLENGNWNAEGVLRYAGGTKANWRVIWNHEDGRVHFYSIGAQTAGDLDAALGLRPGAIAAATPAEKRGSGRFVVSQNPAGGVKVRELEPGVSYLQSVGGSGGLPSQAKPDAHKSAAPKLKGTSLDQPAR